MRTLKTVIWRINNFFFDIDPEEPPDYAGAAIFYGYYVVIFVTLAVVAFEAL